MNSSCHLPDQLVNPALAMLIQPVLRIGVRRRPFEHEHVAFALELRRFMTRRQVQPLAIRFNCQYIAGFPNRADPALPSATPAGLHGRWLFASR